MKRIFNEVLVIILFLFSFSLNALMFISNKVNYVNLDIKKSMSVESVSEVYESLDGVVVSCLLDYGKFSYIDTNNYDLNNIEDMREARREFNEKGGKYHSEKNQNVKDKIGELDYEYVYVSKYSPYIEFGFSSEKFSEDNIKILKTLDGIKDISEISVREGCAVREGMMNGASMCSGSWDDFSNGLVTGDGVNIGLLELGIIDKNHVNISGSNYTIRSYWLNSKDIHATTMASLIGGNYGLAPDAHIYNAQAAGSLVNEMDWFVDKNVDIINMSFGEGNVTGEYGTDSAVADYYAKTYGILMVASAGNEGTTTGYVANPGLGYNVLTVGSIAEEHIASGFTSAYETIGPEKPTLMMYGGCVTVPNFEGWCCGTSQAAALVTGSMAMIYELYPVLKNQPERALALATACSLSLEGYPVDTDNGTNDIIGAGVFRYNTIKENYQNSCLFTHPSNSGNCVVYQKTVDLTCADKIKICLTWFADSDLSADGTTFNDYDIKIYNSSNQLVAIGGSLDDNLEVLTYMASFTDTYTIKVFQYDAAERAQRLGFAYQVIEYEYEE